MFLALARSLHPGFSLLDFKTEIGAMSFVNAVTSSESGGVSGSLCSDQSFRRGVHLRHADTDNLAEVPL